jgi:predicted metal-dependent phosphoesterase TrpH
MAILAHPMLTQKDELIPQFVRAGLDGIEAYYPNCSMEVANFYVGIAQKHGILASTLTFSAGSRLVLTTADTKSASYTAHESRAKLQPLVLWYL